LDGVPTFVLISLLALLLVMSAFFSGSETGLMTLNRYRLKTRAKNGERAAKLAESLLQRPDRLIGAILLGNNFVNSLAASVSTVIALRIFPGETAIAIGTGAVTLLLLVFGEVTPKTLAALHPERIGLPAAYVLYPLMKLFYPVVWVINVVARGILRMMGVSPEEAASHSLSAEELRTVVAEAGAMIPQRHQRMLLSILDLERETVEDIMIPRNEIFGIDISEPWPVIQEAILNSSHTRLPVYDGTMDGLKGVVHMRKLVRAATMGQLNLETLLGFVREPYFIPEGTPLNQQLLNFQDQKRRIGFVVDEYGDIQGLVTLEDILEEVVGEFTSDPSTRLKHITLDHDGSALVAGNVTIRNVNRALSWKLPADGPKTINGLIVEHLGEIPKPGKVMDIDGYIFEIIDVRGTVVKTARCSPKPADPNTSA